MKIFANGGKKGKKNHLLLLKPGYILDTSQVQVSRVHRVQDAVCVGGGVADDYGGGGGVGGGGGGGGVVDKGGGGVDDEVILPRVDYKVLTPVKV